MKVSSTLATIAAVFGDAVFGDYSCRLKAKIHYTILLIPRSESVTSWQLPRLLGSYAETGLTGVGHQDLILDRST